jgi:hypothetical protein
LIAILSFPVSQLVSINEKIKNYLQYFFLIILTDLYRSFFGRHLLFYITKISTVHSINKRIINGIRFQTVFFLRKEERERKRYDEFFFKKKIIYYMYYMYVSFDCCVIYYVLDMISCIYNNRFNTEK